MKKIFLVLFFTLLVCFSCAQEFSGKHYSLIYSEKSDIVYSPNASYVVCLEKDPARDFVILNLSDVQISAKKTIDDDLKERITSLKERVNPDLITITGDLAYGNTVNFIALCDFMDSLDTPWTVVFGNHDHEELGLTTKMQCKILESYPNCCFKTGPRLGFTSVASACLGNYVINIIEKSASSFRVVKPLVFVDSGNEYFLYPPETEDNIRYDDMNYDKMGSLHTSFINNCVLSASEYSGGNELKCALFLHIPIYEYVKAVKAALKTNIDVYDSDAFISYAQQINFEESYSPSFWNDGYKDSFGVIHEPVSCPPYEDGVFDAIRPNTDIIIAGHDHVNSLSINYRGVRFTYGLKTGRNSYYESGMTGGSVIKVRSDGSVDFYHVLDEDI